MLTGIMSLPPKTAEQYAARARMMDGCVKYGDAYEFAPSGNTVVCLIMLDPPMGHVGKDARRAAEIRAELTARATSPTA